VAAAAAAAVVAALDDWVLEPVTPPPLVPEFVLKVVNPVP